MPNWVQSYIEFEGTQSNIDKVFDKIRSLNNNDRDNIFDFDRLIPMPKALNIESGSRSNLAYSYYMLSVYDSIPNDSYTDEQTVRIRIENEDEESRTELFNLGKQIKDNIDRYGTADWYSWCIDNWGTKWSACDAVRDGSTMFFRTAWSWPEPIINKLAELCHGYDVDFHGKWADEDCGNNAGEFCAEDGEMFYDYYDSGTSAAYKAYADCWGETLCIGQRNNGEYFHHECGENCPNYDIC